MAALTDLSDIVNRTTGGNSGTPENIWWMKDSRIGSGAAGALVQGRWNTLWQYNGYRPQSGSYPGASARNPDNTTAGALGQANPGGGRQKWFLGGSFVVSTTGTVMLVDRLADYSGLVGNVNTAQNTTSLAVTRYTGTAAAGNQIWIEIITQIGTTGTTVVASYTNEDGTSGRTTQAVSIGGTGLREVQRAIPLGLQSGDEGVRSVESITLTVSTGTAGEIAVAIVRPITLQPMSVVGVGAIRDHISGLPGPVEIMSGAALSFMFYANGTAAPQLFGNLNFVEA